MKQDNRKDTCLRKLEDDPNVCRSNGFTRDSILEDNYR